MFFVCPGDTSTKKGFSSVFEKKKQDRKTDQKKKNTQIEFALNKMDIHSKKDVKNIHSKDDPSLRHGHILLQRSSPLMSPIQGPLHPTITETR